MIEAITYQEMLENINENMRQHGIKEDTIGILFTRPDLETGRSILDSLEYFHFRTGKTINFYLPGYGAYWNNTYSDGKVVSEIKGVKWYFSNEMFVRFEEDIEKHSKWSYSGESELLLVEYKDGKLSYENMMQFHLDNMLRDNVITSVHGFFEQLFRICKNKETLVELSNSLGFDKAKQITKERILEKIPMGLGDVFTQEKYFCVRNMER